MTTTDQDAILELQNALAEQPDSSVMESDLWTIDEVIDALNEKQRELLKLTGVVRTHETIDHTAGSTLQPLPQSTISVHGATWQGADGSRYPLQVADTWGLDHGLPSWQTEPEVHPRFYQDAEVPQQQLRTYPPTFSSGTLLLLHTALGTALSNTGIAFTVPDEMVPLVIWGALETLLRKAGRGQDAQRADYCNRRWQEGLLAIEVLMAGGF